MWKIEKCYKIIFEAILEQDALKKNLYRDWNVY